MDNRPHWHRKFFRTLEKHAVIVHFFLSESVAFRRVYGLESYSRTSGESNHQWQSVSDTSAAIPTEPRGRLKHDVIYPRNQSWADQGDQGVV